MGFFDRFRKKKSKKPTVKRKANRTRRKKPVLPPEELPSGAKVGATDTKVVGKRRPNESQELKAKKPDVTTVAQEPKPPSIAAPKKQSAGTPPMQRREAATAPSMAAEHEPKSIGSARKKKSSTFIGKDARKKAAVTKEELEASGLSLREYLNKQQGKTRKSKTVSKKELAESGLSLRDYLNKQQGKTRKKASGGRIKSYARGGSVRGAGIATKGVRPCKMR
jgi:hypothetical protein